MNNLAVSEIGHEKGESQPCLRIRRREYRKGDQVDWKLEPYYYPVALLDVVFPVRFARPELLEVTSEAMALKVFDEIGVLPRRRGRDPVIVGRIIEPKTKSRVSFLIGWYVNTAEL